MVKTDPARLRQILINVVGNAIKFTGAWKRSGELAPDPASRPDLPPDFSFRTPALACRAQTLSHLFEEFTQGDPSISRRFGGTGLGLAICRRVAAALGGSIRATSQLGRGKRVYRIRDTRAALWTRFPYSEGAKLDSPAPSGMRVLVAEDNAVNQQVVVGLLMRIGPTSSSCRTDGKPLRHSAAVLRSRTYGHADAGDGRSCSDPGTEAPGCSDPIVGLTANAFESDQQACFDAGMDSFVAKPVTRANSKRPSPSLPRAVGRRPS